MNRENITELVAKYEESHAVEEYTAYGWHVWPALRILAAWTLYTQDESSERARGRNNRIGNARTVMDVIRRVKGIPRLALALARTCGLSLNGARFPRTKAADVAILTYDNRVQRKGGFFYHYLVDPLVEALCQQDKTSVVWELGRNPKLPRVVQHSFCETHLTDQRIVESLLCKFGPPPRPPDWFGAYTTWWKSNVGGDLAWNKVSRYLQKIDIYSRIFEKWLRRSRCSVLIVDCWYTSRSMGAILAASRLGIWSIDFQHGLQGQGHFAYSSWLKGPKNGYEVMPDAYWVWGKEDARALVRLNCGTVQPENVIVGGNLWMNKWMNGGDRDITDATRKAKALGVGYNKRILVTLQKGIEFKNELFPAIRSSPSDWLWLVRLHRQQFAAREAIEREFRTLGCPHVNLRQATDLPLYALFLACDCHITWYSTCAVEALGFGVPTIVLHPSGLYAFRQYIEAGAMVYCTDGRKIVDVVRWCADRPEEARWSFVSRLFASPWESEMAVRVLAAKLGSGRWHGRAL